MFKGKRSQAVFLGIMIGIMVFLTIIALIQPLKENIVISRDVAHLDCSNTSISVGQQGACILIDFFLFYFIGVGIAVALSFITGVSVYNKLRQQ